MKQMLLLILFTGTVNFLFSQTNDDTVYQSEVKKIQKQVELNLMNNSDLFCEDFIGSTIWLVISKDSIKETQVRIITTDQTVRKKFEIIRNRKIVVNWPLIDKDFNNLSIIQPVSITCLGQDKIDNSSWFAFTSMFDILFEGKPSKMIVFKTMSFDIGPRRTKLE